jgi:hypothetical protein
MSLVAYAGRRWKIFRIDGNPMCQDMNDVTFSPKLVEPGEPPKVTIRCSDHTFEGTYDEGLNTISGENYVIKMQITFEQTGPPSTGSWTAEDNGPWPGGG